MLHLIIQLNVRIRDPAHAEGVSPRIRDICPLICTSFARTQATFGSARVATSAADVTKPGPHITGSFKRLKRYATIIIPWALGDLSNAVTRLVHSNVAFFTENDFVVFVGVFVEADRARLVLRAFTSKRWA